MNGSSIVTICLLLLIFEALFPSPTNLAIDTPIDLLHVRF